MSASWALLLAVLTPLLAAPLAFVWPAAGRWLALVTVACSGLSAARLAQALGQDQLVLHRVGGWVAPLGIQLRADGLAVLLLLALAVVGGVVACYAPAYFAASSGARGDASHPRGQFWPPFLLLWAGLAALALSADIFNLYVTLELLTLAAVTLVALAGKHEALQAAMRYLLVSLGASLLYLLGVALVYGQLATVDLPLIAQRARPGPALWLALLLMSGGLLAKAALFPLHFWLPPAHGSAPAPVSALLSALVVKGPFVILLRLWFEAFPALIPNAAVQALGTLGAAAILWGSLNALRQSRLKLMVAYSTVAQLGYLFLLLPLASDQPDGFLGWSGGLLFLLAHACAKTAMFLATGNIIHAAGHDRIAQLDGVTHVLPVSSFAFGLSGMSLVGLPPSGGFAGKWLLLRAALDQRQWWWAAVLLLGSLLAAAYVIRVLFHAFTLVGVPRRTRPIPAIMEWTALLLSLLAAGLGFGSSWAARLLRVGAPVRGAP